MFKESILLCFFYTSWAHVYSIHCNVNSQRTSPRCQADMWTPTIPIALTVEQQTFMPP